MREILGDGTPLQSMVALFCRRSAKEEGAESDGDRDANRVHKHPPPEPVGAGLHSHEAIDVKQGVALIVVLPQE